MLNTTDKIIKHKTGLLNLAEELGSPSENRIRDWSIQFQVLHGFRKVVF